MDYQVALNTTTSSGRLRHGNCEDYLLFHFETSLSNGLRASLYFLGLAYCFIGLSSITARFFRSMENVVKQTREVVVKDLYTNVETIKHEKVWNFAIADITLLAFGTSFPQISLATIDAIRNIGQLYAGGLGPGTLVGSAAFDLFPIHAICVIVPKAGTVKKISDIGVWLVELFWSFWAYVWLYIILKFWTPDVITVWEASLTVLQYGLLLLHAYAQDKRLPYFSVPLPRDERPDDWVPNESVMYNEYQNNECSEEIKSHESAEGIVDIFSIHSENYGSGSSYHNVPDGVKEETSVDEFHEKPPTKQLNVLSIWKQHFLDVVDISDLRKTSNQFLCFTKVFWKLVLLPWRFMFAFVPPYQIAHGWVAFICSLTFISGVAYVVTKITDLISCVTGINPYVIAFTALAAGTSWPDLVASKIAAERQLTADSAIANITCSNSVNIYVGIGVPWLIDTLYNFIVYREPLRVENAAGLSFSLIVFFITSVGCISVLVFRRLTIGAELGGPRIWAWLTSAYFMILWLIFVVLSSMKVSGLF